MKDAAEFVSIIATWFVFGMGCILILRGDLTNGLLTVILVELLWQRTKVYEVNIWEDDKDSESERKGS